MRWYFGFSGSNARSHSTPERLAFFLVLGIPVFLGCWLAFQVLLPVYVSFLGMGAQIYYSFSGRSFQFLTRGSKILFRSFSAPAFEADLAAQGIYANTVFLWTLILLIPTMPWRKRGAALALGTFLLYLCQVAFLVTKVEAGLIGAHHPAAGNAAWWHFWDDFFEITGKAFFPVAIWIPLGLKYFLGFTESPAGKGRRSAGRNDPCPCGSGKKFKRCCGR